MSFYGQRRYSAWTKNFKRGIEVDRTKIEVIEKLHPPIFCEGCLNFFLVMLGFIGDSSRIFSKIANLLCRLLEKEVKFEFTEAFLKAF